MRLARENCKEGEISLKLKWCCIHATTVFALVSLADRRRLFQYHFHSQKLFLSPSNTPCVQQTTSQMSMLEGLGWCLSETRRTQETSSVLFIPESRHLCCSQLRFERPSWVHKVTSLVWSKVEKQDRRFGKNETDRSLYVSLSAMNLRTPHI